MGWTSFPMNEPIKDWFKSIWSEKREVVDCALVKRRTLYGAIKNVETGEIFCAVFLIRWSRGYYNFSYKDMDEFCGPVESDCPMRIIKLLSPLNDENDPHHWARDWRKRVEDYHSSRKKIKDGIVKLSSPATFASGHQFQYFKKIGRQMYGGIMENNQFQPICRVRINLSYHNFEII